MKLLEEAAETPPSRGDEGELPADTGAVASRKAVVERKGRKDEIG